MLTINETGATSFGAGAVSTLTSKITGVGSVVIPTTATGTLTLTATNDYTGGTTINGGKLALAGGTFVGAIYGGDVAINANGILGVNTTANLVDDNPIPPMGANTTATALINSGGTMSIDSNFDASVLVDPASIGILALNTNNSSLSGTNGSSAFIGAYGPQTLSTMTLAPGAGGTYRLGGDGGTLTVTNGVLTGPTNNLIVGSTQPNGAGTVVLAAANTFGGGTTVNNGTLRTTADGALGSGGLAINAVAGANSTASIQSNETVSSLSSSVSGGGAATLSIAAGKTLTDNQAGNTTFAGTLNNSGTLTKSGAGTLEITAAPLLATGSALAVNGTGKLRFNVTSDSAFVGTGVVATVSDSAVLELAGTVSALDQLVVKGRADVMNNSNAAAGLLVTGQNQQVGGINGLGTTQVNADAQLTADHIVQSALVIGGSAGHPSLVTIDASDATGNPLASVASLSPSGTSASIGSFSSSSASGASMPTLGSGTNGINAVGSSGISLVTGGAAAAVPEPSAIALALFALAAAGFAIRRRVA
ncbi:MAG TPA: autotransporter-associated beta strand repeat-containing protein [Pirellulales bacterium]